MSEKPPAPKLKIMVVDDDQVFRERLVSALAGRDMEAYGSASPSQARELSARIRPDRAVVDLRMPGGSGLELIPDLLKANPDMDIVVLTGYGSIATALEATRRGAMDYLTKPADADQILAVFENDGEDTLPADTTPSLARVEWEHIQRVLADCDGNVAMAARTLGVHRRSLQRKLGKHPPES